MRRLYGILALFMSLSLAWGLAAGAEAASPFHDLDQVEEEFREDILALAAAGILHGYEDGSFRPLQHVKRAQAAKVIAMALGLEPRPEAAERFEDVTLEADRGWIGALVAEGIARGTSETTFAPYAEVTRQQLASFFIRALGLEDVAQQLDLQPRFVDAHLIDLSHRANVALATEIGFLQGRLDGTFGPRESSRRSHLAKFGNQLYSEAESYQAAGQRVYLEMVGKPYQPPEPGDEQPAPPPPQPPAEPVPSPNRPLKLFIDPGHGGSDPGAHSQLPNGQPIREKDINLEIALEVQRILQEEYAWVETRLSRTDDTTIPLEQRPVMANEWGADYFLSLHVNATGKGNASGFESYIWNGPVTQPTVDKQSVIHSHVVQTLKLKDRGMKRANFHVLRETRMPAILLENLFIDHPDDQAMLADPEFRKKLARAIAEGVALAWNLPKVEDAPARAAEIAAKQNGALEQTAPPGAGEQDDTPEPEEETSEEQSSMDEEATQKLPAS